MTKHAAIGAVRAKLFALPVFAFHANAALRATQSAPGCLWAGTTARNGYAFSLSVWDSPAKMKAFAHSPIHARAMRWTWLTAEVTQFCHFQVDTVPTWQDAFAQWDAMTQSA